MNIKSDAILETTGGARTHKVIELYDIQFVEPDPKEFELEGFTFKGKGPAVCAKPGAAPPLESLRQGLCFPR